MNQQIVPFYGDQLIALQDERGVWAPLKPMCEALGLADNKQAARLKRSPWASTTMTVALAEDGRARELFALHLKSVPMWLATIASTRVRPEVREKLARYQREAADVLARAFVPQVVPVATVAVSAAELEDLRRRMAAMEADRWRFVNGALASHERLFDAVQGRIADLERQLKQLRAGARVQATGRRGGSERKVKPRAPRPLSGGATLPLIPGRAA